MENMINLAEILKDCPKGMELDCTNYSGVVTFKQVIDSDSYPIKINVKIGNEYFTHTLTEYGQVYKTPYNKCVIFPKGKTTWENFQRPFKNGDVVTSKSDSNIVAFIYKKRINTTLVKSHFILYTDNMGIYKNGCIALKEDEIVFATKEEKEKLFDVIKEHGYHWNDETKTLEILIKPKFKIGDRIRHKLTGNVYEVSSFLSNGYGSGVYEIGIINELIVKIIDIKEQDNYELLPNKFDTNDLKPFETRVLVRNKYGYLWKPAIFGYYIKNEITPYCVVGGTCWRQCIPYEGNEHLLGTIDDCDEFYKNW